MALVEHQEIKEFESRVFQVKFSTRRLRSLGSTYDRAQNLHHGTQKRILEAADVIIPSRTLGFLETIHRAYVIAQREPPGSDVFYAELDDQAATPFFYKKNTLHRISEILKMADGSLTVIEDQIKLERVVEVMGS
jgi:hypothetical protein